MYLQSRRICSAPTHTVNIVRQLDAASHEEEDEDGLQPRQIQRRNGIGLNKGTFLHLCWCKRFGKLAKISSVVCILKKSSSMWIKWFLYFQTNWCCRNSILANFFPVRIWKVAKNVRFLSEMFFSFVVSGRSYQKEAFFASFAYEQLKNIQYEKWFIPERFWLAKFQILSLLSLTFWI